MRVVILGCGRVGSNLANRLDREGHDVVVIDHDADALRRLAPGFGGFAIVGTGIDEDVLRRARIQQADAFAAVTDRDNTNIMASELVRTLFHVPKVVTRIYDPTREETYQLLGLQTICPTTLGANLIKRMLEGALSQSSAANGPAPRTPGGTIEPSDAVSDRRNG